MNLRRTGVKIALAPDRAKTMISNIVFTCLIIAALFLLLSIDSVHSYIERHSHKISTLSRLFSIFGVFSILFAAISISESTRMEAQRKRLQEENNQILFENIKEEIDENLEQIAAFKRQGEKLTQNSGTPVREFNYFYLERAKDHMKERSLRRIVNQTIRAMRSANDTAKIMTNHAFVATDSKKVAASHKKFREETVETLRREYDRIHSNLVGVRDKLRENSL